MIISGLTFVEFFRYWIKDWEGPATEGFAETMLAGAVNEMLHAEHTPKCMSNPHGCSICMVRAALNDYHTYTFYYKKYVKSLNRPDLK